MTTPTTAHTPDEPRNVAEAIAALKAELPDLPKDQMAAPGQGGYPYRGIEGITSAVQRLEARLGIVWTPHVVSEPQIVDIVVNGKPWTDTRLMVSYTVRHGPSNTELTVGPILGIGRDNSDKGGNKALTQAYKYALLQTYTISGARPDEADGVTAEADQPSWHALGYASAAAAEESAREIRTARAAIPPEDREPVREWYRTHHYDLGGPVPAADVPELLELIARCAQAQR